MCTVSETLSSILFFIAIFFDVSFALLQTVIYWSIRHTMKRKLYYFYNRVIKQLKIICICKVIYLLSNSILLIITLHFGKDLHFYLELDTKNPASNSAYLILGSTQRILLMVYIYFSTKFIDLEFYIRLLMYGYRVLNRFEKMSLFITRSWYSNNHSESSEEDLLYNDQHDSDEQESKLLEEDTVTIFHNDQQDSTSQDIDQEALHHSAN